MRGNWYQLSLIFLGLLVTALFGVFLHRELFPEYKIYQNTYMELEQFRSQYSGSPPSAFSSQIKQIVKERADKGPVEINRCTSCHVALQFSHFSPTRITIDINGNTVYDDAGLPVLEPNPNYIWDKLDQKITSLKADGKESEAERYQAFKTAHVGDHVYDMTKVLRAHPLIGRETRPFETHPIDEYGCVICHNGNGRGLTTEKAHGPVFDGQYEVEYMGYTPQFTEKDPLNDPIFSRIFNHKPGHELLFQTTPIYIAPLLQAKCVQCHTSSLTALQDASKEASLITSRRLEKYQAVREGFENEKNLLVSLLKLKKEIKSKGLKEIKKKLEKSSEDHSLPRGNMLAARKQLAFLQRQGDTKKTLDKINDQLIGILGSQKLVNTIQADRIDQFLKENKQATGSLFKKQVALGKDEKLLTYIKKTELNIKEIVVEEQVHGVLASEIDRLISNFHRGENLYLSQACYACHRIDGLARGGVGPDLTDIGDKYPWEIKQAIVWPQGNLKTSTMPNFHLDHEELADLTTFLLAQLGQTKAISETSYKTQLLKWDAGYKQPWERPINPGKLHDLRESMMIFATQGCAACHRLKGFDSDVGYQIEKDTTPSYDALYREREWFRQLIPEGIVGSNLVKILEANGEDIDKRIVNHVRSDSMLEDLEEKHPKSIESFNTDFKYARRAKNHSLKKKLDHAKTPEQKAQIKKERQQWKDRVNRVLMMYVQEYGLGRIIGPRPNWSGIYRSDEWLIEHFRKPSRHIAKSIMPAMPFDDSKFYALTYMLDVLAKKNRDEIREIWDNFGFNPELAYKLLCSQCHGDYLHGNGPVSKWIYPIPKNLRNADFLRNFTKGNVISSIVHGVKGTPMPPWGEVAQDKETDGGKPVLTEHEAQQLTDWLFSSLLGGTVIRSDEEVDKWQYEPKDVLDELKKEKNVLESEPEKPDLSFLNMTIGEEYIASLEPTFAHKNSQVNEIFNVYLNPFIGPEKDVYYIKQKYYTEANLLKGQDYFELNCSVCHGKEADGQGFRAGSMYDAKPRMLTNFHWIDTRDDLRLLRSIKYGVQGTSMVPWGDQTSSLQRLQLVMYIRSLSIEQQQRDDLFNTIYGIYDHADQVIDQARVKEYTTVNTLEDQLREVKIKELELLTKVEEGEAKVEEALPLYQKEFKFNQKIKAHKAADQLLVEIKELVKKESLIFQTLGIQIISKFLIGNVVEDYIKMVKGDSLDYQVKNGVLILTYDSKKQEMKENLVIELFQDLQTLVNKSEKEKEVVEGELPSSDRAERLEILNGDMRAYRKIQASLTFGIEESKRLKKKQLELYTAYESKLKTLKTQQI